MMAFSQTRLQQVNVGSLYFVIYVVLYYGFCTDTLTSDKSSSTYVFSDGSFSHISCRLFYILYTTAAAFAKVVLLSCGGYVYLHCLFLRVMVGQV